MWPYTRLLGGGGGLGVPLGGAPFPLAGEGFVLLDVNDVSHPHLPLPPHMDTHGKPCHVRPLRPPLLPTREHMRFVQKTNPSRAHRPLHPDPRHPGLHPPVPTHKPVGKHAHQLLPRRQVGPPPDHNGVGEGDAEGALHPPGLPDHVPRGTEVPLPPIRPGRHLLGPGRIRLPGGQGDPVKGGGSVWASLNSSRDGMGTTTSRATCPVAVLASLPPERPERRDPSLRTLPASLGGRPPPVPAGWSPPGPSGGSACSPGNRGRGLYLSLVWCRTSSDHAVNGTCRCGEVCKAQIEKGGVDTRQCKNKRSKMGEIHRNSYEIRAKFVRISYEFHISRRFTQIYSREIRAIFVRNSHEFRTNFVRISREFRPNCQ